MRTDVKLPYDEYVVPHLASIGKSLDPFRTGFNESHGVSVEELKFCYSRYFGTRLMERDWIPQLLNAPHSFLGTLYTASIYRDVITQQIDQSLVTAALRHELFYLIGQELLKPDSAGSDSNIIAVTYLMAGGVIEREANLIWHEAGIDVMIKQRGGLTNINATLASTVSWIAFVSSILQEKKPGALFQDYSTSRSFKKYLNSATLPESPLFRLRDMFRTLTRSEKCKPSAPKVSNDIWVMIDVFLFEKSERSHFNTQTILNLYKQVTNDYEPLQYGQVLTEADCKYEAIRLTSIIQATAIVSRCSLSASLELIMKDGGSSSACEDSSSTSSCPFIAQSSSSSYTKSSSTSSHSASQSLFEVTDDTIEAGSILIEAGTLLPQSKPQHSKPDDIIQSLKDALEKSNLSDCWSDMAGVLLWIGLTAGAASWKSDNKVLKCYFAALAIRTGFFLGFEHSEAIHATVLRMGETIAKFDSKFPEKN